jgi:serine/threonine protein kinase
VTDFASLYKLKGLLGVGAFGVVLLVYNRHTQEDSALKIVNKTRLSPEALEFLSSESIILKNLSFPPT